MGFVLWDEFRKALQNKFYPLSFCDAKRNGFVNLVQGDTTIVEYEKNFTKLAKYALAFVMDEADKCKHFEDGLRTEIRALVTTNMN